MKTKLTKIDRVIAALRKSPLTRKQISARFNVPNVRAILFDIKRKGYVLLSGDNRVAIARAG